MKKTATQILEKTGKILQSKGSKSQACDDMIGMIVHRIRICDLYWSERFD